MKRAESINTLLFALLAIAFVAPVLHAQTSSRIGEIKEGSRGTYSGPSSKSKESSAQADIQNQVKVLTKKMLTSGPGFGLAGVVERGNSTPYSINGEDFTIEPDAVISGTFKVGVNARVEGTIVNGSEKKATNILVAAENGSSGSSGEENFQH